MSLDDQVNDVYRKIGRNVVLFQKLEYYLKYIVAYGSISGYASEIKEKQDKHISCVKKKTMGTLVGKYVEHINPDYEKPPEPEDPTKAYLSFNFHLEPDSDFYETKKEDLAKLVAERNELIHNLLPEFNINSEESCRVLEEKLDKQCEKIRSELKQIESVARVFKQAKKDMADFYKSEEGEKHFNLSFIIHLLDEIATQIKRPDGWASMHRADQLLQQRAPEVFTSLKKKHNYKSLKNIIEESGFFDIYEEPTEKGGTRILYRCNAIENQRISIPLL